MVTEMAASPKVMVGHESLEKFCIQVLEELSVPRDEAEITANTLVTANLRAIGKDLRIPIDL